MILTIGMIVKNEADKLYKCLKSLDGLRNAVSSELIIVDTGSTDDTVKIAREFTDDVREFEWCGDFSAARNKSMENANGEWFMFIDADEWFENCDNMIRFFNSGEYKKYNSATYIQRNYFTTNVNGAFSDYDAPRLAKINPDTKFIKRIHEHISTIGEPIKKINSFVHHFGYAEVKPGDVAKKKKRNEELMLKSLEDDADNISLYFQLYDCYFGVDDEKAIKYARMGIEVADRTKSNYYARYVFLSLIAFVYFADNKFEKSIEVINEFKESRPKDKLLEDFILTDVDIAAMEVHSYYNLDNIEAAYSACVKYNTAYSNYKSNKFSMIEALVHATNFTSELEYTKVNIIYLKILLEQDNFQDAMIVIKKIGIDKIFNNLSYQQSCVQAYDIIDIVLKNNKLEDFINSIAYDGYVADVFDNAFRLKVYDETGVHKDFITGILSLNNIPKRLSQIFNLYNELFCKKSDISNLGYYIDNFDFLPEYLADVLWLALRCRDNDTIYNVFKMIKSGDALAYVNNLLMVRDFADDYIIYLQNNECKDVVVLRSMLELLEAIISHDSIDSSKVMDLFGQFSRIGYEYLSIICKAEYLNDDKIDALPAEQRKYYYCHKAFKGFEIDDTKSCVYYMKKVAKYYNSAKKVVSAMSSVTSQKGEFYTLSKQIKDNIKLYIYQDDKANASKLLDEYSQINPSDEDIKTLRIRLAAHFS